MTESQNRGPAAATSLRRVIDTIWEEVGHMPASLITWQPAEDVWSVMDILCHIREFVPYWTAQAVGVIEHPNQPWGRTHTDKDRLAAVENTARFKLADLEADIRQVVSESAERLERLTDAELDTQAPSLNPRWGQKPAHFIVDDLLVSHAEKHLGQIRRNVRQYPHHAFAFSAPLPVHAGIRGRTDRFPIGRIFCVGRNYEAHAREMGETGEREAPFYFTKAAQDYLPSGSTVPYPPGTSNYQHEIELVVAIGKPGFRVAKSDAIHHVFGYACGLDMTRRDLQLALRDQKRPWDIGKDFEQSAVLTDIVPAAEEWRPSEGRIELRVNGEVRQSSDLSLLIYDVPSLIAHLSNYYHLQPGDLIYTGTPAGVGPVVPGDVVEGSIAGIGTIRLNIGPAE